MGLGTHFGAKARGSWGDGNRSNWYLHYLVVMTSANFLRLLRDFVSEYNHAKFGCNWTTNKGETVGAQCPPPLPAYMVPKDPRLNRVKSGKTKLWSVTDNSFFPLLSCAKVKSPCHILEEQRNREDKNYTSGLTWNVAHDSGTWGVILLPNLALKSPASIKKSPFRHM